ncbi:MAG: hypothetical protein CXZ00_12425 [Acidobacteria bacterium]|nr:MAG: hypothetical protein CXZ00_12425 [Acidobacteriota bacterium]
MSDQQYHVPIPATISSVAEARAKRISKREQIERFFAERLGQKILSTDLHARFGSAVRTRISELNRSNSCQLVISNKVTILPGGVEESTYVAEVRP